MNLFHEIEHGNKILSISSEIYIRNSIQLYSSIYVEYVYLKTDRFNVRM